MSPKRCLPIFLFVLLAALFVPAFFSSNVRLAEAQTSPEEVMQEGVPIVQQNGSLIVAWTLVKQAPFAVNVSVQNLLSAKRQINLTAIIDSLSFPTDKLQVEAFYEWKNVSYTVQEPDYGIGLVNMTFADVKNLTLLSPPVNVTVGNPDGPNYAEVVYANGTAVVGYLNYTEERETVWNITFFWEAQVVVGYHEETRYMLDWKPCKMQTVEMTTNHFKANMELITLPPYGSKPSDGTVNGTKQFRLVFATPIGWNVQGRVALDVDGFSFDPWFNLNWQYRKSHVINAASDAGTNYQVRIVAHYGSGVDSGADVYLNSKCRTDFGDIRFTDDDGTTLLDYWMESYTASDNAVFWVEVADDLSTNPVTIYIYYGKSDATTISNGTNTFWQFDDFDSDRGITWVPDGQGTWQIESGGVSGNQYTGSVVSPTAATVSLNSLTIQNLEITLYAHHISAWSSDAGYRILFRRVDANNHYDFGLVTNYGQWMIGKVVNGALTWIASSATNYSNDWHKIIIKCVGTSIKVLVDDTPIIDTTDSSITSAGYIALAAVRGKDGFDILRARKLVDPEPSHGSWGSEEGQPTIGEFQAPATVYANKYFLLNATVNDAHGVIAFVNATLELSNGVVLMWNNATDTFSELQDTYGYCTLDSAGSFKTNLNTTAHQLSWKIKLSWSFPEGYVSISSTNTKVFDSAGLSGSNSYTSLFYFEDDLIVYSASVDDARINPGQTVTFSGKLYYEGTTTPPEDVSGITAKVDLDTTNKGSNTTIGADGSFSISFSGEATVGLYSYTVYSVTDENSVQNQTVNVVVDGLKLPQYILDLQNEIVYVQAMYAYDSQPVANANVSYAGLYALTNSTGWAEFNVSDLASVDWNSLSYSVSEPTYGLTYKAQNQTVAFHKLAAAPFSIRGNNEITTPNWDDVNRKLSFTTSGTCIVKVGDWGTPLRVEVDGTTYTDWTYDSAKQEVTISNLASNVALIWQTGGAPGGVPGGPGGVTPTPGETPVTPPVYVPPEAVPLVNVGLITIVAIVGGAYLYSQVSKPKTVKDKWKQKQKQSRPVKWKKKSRFEE